MTDHVNDHVKIITHPGRSHRDDFLACCLVMADLQDHPITLHRREPLEAELLDPEVFVIDVGGIENSEYRNFDHHQLPADNTRCALTLILEHMGALEAIKEFYSWLDLTEVMDCQGPQKAAKYLGIKVSTLSKTQSPVEKAMLSCFSEVRILKFEPLIGRTSDSDWLAEAMVAIGSQILHELKLMAKRRKWLEDNHSIMHLEENLYCIVIPRKKGILPNPALGLRELRDAAQKEYKIDICMSIVPDERGEGYTFYRYDDHSRVDFSAIKSEAVKRMLVFIASTGFIAKTYKKHSETVLRTIALAALKHE